MNYRTHYERLIERARARTLLSYREKHHVLPRCMGGGDDAANIVELTAEEHYVAHQILVKLYPTIYPLVTATMLMGKKSPNNKAYGWLRRRNALAMGSMTERNAKIRASMIGNKRAAALRGKKRAAFSDEWKANISAGKKGQLPWIAGKKHSNESRQKMSRSMRGISDSTIAAIRADSRSQSLIARDHGLSQQHVSRIKAHKIGPNVRS